MKFFREIPYLKDIYSDKAIIHDGVVPEEYVYTSAGYFPPDDGGAGSAAQEARRLFDDLGRHAAAQLPSLNKFSFLAGITAIYNFIGILHQSFYNTKLFFNARIAD